MCCLHRFASSAVRIDIDDILICWSFLCSTVKKSITEISWVRATEAKTGRDPFNQNSNRSDREKWSTSKGGPVFTKLFRLDRTDPLSFGPKFPNILVEWIAPTYFAAWKMFFTSAGVSFSSGTCALVECKFRGEIVSSLNS